MRSMRSKFVSTTYRLRYQHFSVASRLFSATATHEQSETEDTLAPEEPKSFLTLPFEQFNLDPKLVTSLKSKGLLGMFPIQAATYNAIVDGTDIIARARTGTGKTLAFLLPMIDDITKQKSKVRHPKALILAPTRELARQVHDEITRVAPWVPTVCCHGGVSYMPQRSQLERGVEIVVGTPGRVKDLIESKALVLAEIKTLVMDEADHMLDIGFADDMETVMKLINAQQLTDEEESKPAVSKYQTLMFSATVPTWVKSVSKKYLRPGMKMIDLVGNSETQAGKNIKYQATPCHPSNRASLLIDMFRLRESSHSDNEKKRVIIFTETKRDVDEIAASLNMYNRKMCSVLHGDVSQNVRQETLDAFKRGTITCLVATDVAARGLDVSNVDLVVQMGLPPSIEPFLHRSGRTGRAGKQGSCLTLFDMARESRQLLDFAARAKIEFEILPPPSGVDVAALSTKKVIHAMQTVPRETMAMVQSQVAEVLKKMAPEDAICSLLCVAGNLGNVGDRSLMTGANGWCTMQVNSPNATSYQILAELDEMIPQGMKKLSTTGFRVAGSTSYVIDVPTESKAAFKEAAEKNSMNPSVLDILPPLSKLNSLSGTRSSYGSRSSSYGNNNSRGGGYSSGGRPSGGNVSPSRQGGYGGGYQSHGNRSGEGYSNDRSAGSYSSNRSSGNSSGGYSSNRSSGGSGENFTSSRSSGGNFSSNRSSSGSSGGGYSSNRTPGGRPVFGKQQDRESRSGSRDDSSRGGASWMKRGNQKQR